MSFQKRKHLIKHFGDVLAAEQEHRHERMGGLWMEMELRRMHEEVSRLRFEMGKSELPIEEVRKVECLAVGHSDYSRKFALYCVELVLDIP